MYQSSQTQPKTTETETDLSKMLSMDAVGKWGQITHILERKDREFQEAMRVQVGTTFSHINSSNTMESFKIFTGAGIIAQCTARKKPEFRPCLPLSGINFYRG